MQKCFFCGSTNVKGLRIVQDMLFDNPEKFLLMECTNCGLVFISNRPSPSEIVKFYPMQYLPYRCAIQDEPSVLLRWARTYNVLKRVNLIQNYKTPGTILDIGCSTGIFLDAMKTSGWQSYGIEISEEAAKYARQRFGLDVTTGEFESVSLNENCFDAVTMWDVLEHTFHPLEVLQKVNSILRSDGILALTIPYWESFDHYVFGRYWIGFDVPRHLFVFRKPVLEGILGQAGFTIDYSACRLGGYYTFLASLKLWSNENIQSEKVRGALERFLHFPGMRLPFQPFFALMDLLGLGGTRVVIARKK